MAPPRVSPPGSAQMHKTQQELQNPQTLCCRMARAARSLNQPHPARGNQEKRKLTRVLQAVELPPATRGQRRQPHSKPQLPPGISRCSRGTRSPDGSSEARQVCRAVCCCSEAPHCCTALGGWSRRLPNESSAAPQPARQLPFTSAFNSLK